MSESAVAEQAAEEKTFEQVVEETALGIEAAHGPERAAAFRKMNERLLADIEQAASITPGSARTNELLETIAKRLESKPEPKLKPVDQMTPAEFRRWRQGETIYADGHSPPTNQAGKQGPSLEEQRQQANEGYREHVAQRSREIAEQKINSAPFQAQRQAAIDELKATAARLGLEVGDITDLESKIPEGKPISRTEYSSNLKEFQEQRQKEVATKRKRFM